MNHDIAPEKGTDRQNDDQDTEHDGADRGITQEKGTHVQNDSQDAEHDGMSHDIAQEKGTHIQDDSRDAEHNGTSHDVQQEKGTQHGEDSWNWLVQAENGRFYTCVGAGTPTTLLCGHCGPSGRARLVTARIDSRWGET